MEKYLEAINNISSYEIWHECTYDDGYSNFDDWIEYPFGDDEDIKLLSELITKHDTINKGIDELIEKYRKKIIKCDTDTCRNCQTYHKVIQDLEKLKGE